MTDTPRRGLLSMLAIALVAVVAPASAEEPFRFEGTTCTPAPYLHCPDTECSSATVINQGNVVEMKSRRTYFLDYPCDLKKGEKVTFVLALHGAGSYGNWQRHYFPLVDYKDQYRLVIATPNSPTRVWSEADDEYLHGIVDFVTAQLGPENIQAFWLVGHSQGGMTSNRLIRTEYFKSRVDGWLSLSGGRLGGNPGRSATFAPTRPAGATGSAAPAAPGAAPGSTGPGSSAFAAAMAALREPPDADLSFLYTTGEREVDEKGVPETSDWAAKYQCGPRATATEVVDTKAGYVYDSSRLNLLRPGWGLLPGPGTAKVYRFPDCKDGRVVADVVRLEKGHTEGLEPNVTRQLIELMLSAKGGKIQHGSAAAQPSGAGR
jgi:pimeloyl-ACP methyl ester carboxylesterase